MALAQPDRYGAALVTVALCGAARRWPGTWVTVAGRVIAVGLAWAQRASGRTGAMTAAGSDLQSMPGTSMKSSTSLPSGSRT